MKREPDVLPGSRYVITRGALSHISRASILSFGRENSIGSSLYFKLANLSSSSEAVDLLMFVPLAISAGACCAFRSVRIFCRYRCLLRIDGL